MYQNIENEISFSPSSSTIWTQISGVQLIHKKLWIVRIKAASCWEKILNNMGPSISKKIMGEGD